MQPVVWTGLPFTKIVAETSARILLCNFMLAEQVGKFDVVEWIWSPTTMFYIRRCHKQYPLTLPASKTRGHVPIRALLIYFLMLLISIRVNRFVIT